MRYWLHFASRKCQGGNTDCPLNGILIILPLISYIEIWLTVNFVGNARTSMRQHWTLLWTWLKRAHWRGTTQKDDNWWLGMIHAPGVDLGGMTALAWNIPRHQWMSRRHFYQEWSWGIADWRHDDRGHGDLLSDGANWFFCGWPAVLRPPVPIQGTGVHLHTECFEWKYLWIK